MKFIADIHIHSHYSIATSKNLAPEYLDYWARIKGIHVIGTGDCVHPGWLNELKEKLEPAGNGLYRLTKEYHLRDVTAPNSTNSPEDVFFMLTGEISNIYKKNGKVRKVHNLCVFPDFEAVESVQEKLKKIGNIESDGRPILGLDSKILLEMVLESSDKSFLIPAHIWTPWFSILGSKSGFNNVEECYEDLTPHIFALETGLSSDPPMNRACSFLDRFKLISNSDAHSPGKLGREANLFDTDISYQGIYNALSGEEGFLGTVEFFPQEGKYHYDGHRKCNICWDPLETLKNNGICSVCGKPVTRGVMYRVAELADRSNISEAVDKRDFYSITSLPDLLTEILDKKSSSTKAVQKEYFRLIENLGSEFYILLYAETNEINEIGGELIAEGIERLRNGNVIIEEGFDGEFGRIKVFNKEERSAFTGASLFTSAVEKSLNQENTSRLSIKFNIEEFQSLYQKNNPDEIFTRKDRAALELTEEQRDGVEHLEGPCMVLAGPGSGKTRILIERIIHLVTHGNILPENILAITFSNKAANEMRERVNHKMPSIKAKISTFHAFGLSIIKEHYDKFGRSEHFYITDNEEKREILEKIAGKGNRKVDKKIRQIETYKHGIDTEEISNVFNAYEEELQRIGAFDLDDLIYQPVKLFSAHPDILEKYRKQYPWILVDEYQDINARQYELVMQIAGADNPNLFVIGDPDQSIYGFRGSDIRFIDQLKIDFPNIKLIGLKKSYRCPQPVLQIAGQALRKKDYLLGRPMNMKAHIQETETGKSEADWIAAQIEKMLGGVRSFSIDSGISDGEASTDAGGFSDFCVLCRTMEMFEPIIKAFIDHGIAYQVIGTEPFYRKEPFCSVISQFRKIYYNFLKLESSPSDHQMIDIRQMISNKEETCKIIDILIGDMEISKEDRRQMEQLAKSFGNDYEGFFISLSTRQGIDEYDKKSEAVSLMTLHASKGLEFNTVFIPGCEEGIIPFELFGKKGPAEVKEEERLFYVGITRTRKYLFLTHARKRFLRGRMLQQQKSPFLNRLEKELLHSEIRSPKTTASDEVQLDLF